MPSFREHNIEFDLRRALTRQRRLRRRDRRLPFRLLALLLLTGAAAVYWKWPELEVLREPKHALGPALPSVSDQSRRLVSDRSTRLIYAYSIVPGGVTGAEEARRAVASDPVVGEHYRGLDLARLRLTTLDAEKLAYVSFRKGDQVYWTTKKVRLPAGETVLTDGANLVRARCGNRISDASMSKTTPQEPALVELDTPLLPGGPMAPLGTPPALEQARLLTLGTPPQLPEMPPLAEVPEELITSTPTDGAFSPQEQDEIPGPRWIGFPSSWYYPGWNLAPIQSPLQPPAKTSGKGSGGSQNSGGGDDVQTTSDPPVENSTPEPASWLLVAGALVGLGGLLARVRRGGHR